MCTWNQLTIIGFTGNEADIPYTTNGTLVATLSVATKTIVERRRRRMAEPNGLAPRRDVRQSSRVAHTIAKGSLVMVQGPVRIREYDKDGTRNRVFELRAETMGKLDRTERQEPATGTEDFDA